MSTRAFLCWVWCSIVFLTVKLDVLTSIPCTFFISCFYIFIYYIVALVHFKYGRFVADVTMVLMCVDNNYIDLSATLLL